MFPGVPVRPDFVAVVVTHKRPRSVLTARELRRAGYTGPIWLVLDDEDPTRAEYEALFHGSGVEVRTFSKAATPTETCDNERTRHGVVYARNAVPAMVREAGFRFFAVFDDDYFAFAYRRRSDLSFGATRIRSTMDACLTAFVEYLESCPPSVRCVAFSQGGDHIGGGANKDIVAKRKAMNAFICDTERPFEYLGRMNDDVNAYLLASMRGAVFLTSMSVQLYQPMTQQNSGGLTELYQDLGTYAKTFYSVLVAPSAVRVSTLHDPCDGNPPRRRSSRRAYDARGSVQRGPRSVHDPPGALQAVLRDLDRQRVRRRRLDGSDPPLLRHARALRSPEGPGVALGRRDLPLPPPPGHRPRGRPAGDRPHRPRAPVRVRSERVDRVPVLREPSRAPRVDARGPAPLPRLRRPRRGQRVVRGGVVPVRAGPHPGRGRDRGRPRRPRPSDPAQSRAPVAPGPARGRDLDPLRGGARERAPWEPGRAVVPGRPGGEAGDGERELRRGAGDRGGRPERVRPWH